jgi:hypothetical protein
MKRFFRKIASVKKSEALKKTIVASAAGYALKYCVIDANTDLFVNSRQESQSTNNQKIKTVHEDSQFLTETGLNNSNCSRVKTGSGAMLTFAKDIPAEILIPEAVMVKNNSNSPTTVPGVAHGFSTQPPVNRPTGAGRVNPGQSARTPQFHIPHGIIKDQPVTGARLKQTKLGASKANQNSQSTKSKGSPKPGGSTPTEIDDATCSARSDNQEQQPEYGFVDKKKKNNPDQCQHRILTHRIKEDKGLIRAAEEACRNEKVQRDLNDLEEKLANGNDNPRTHKKYLGNNVWEHRGRKGGRLYTREIDNNIDILAKSGKKPSNQQYVIDRVKELYIE